MKRLNTVLLCLGVGFLGYLVWMVGPKELWGQIRALGWGALLLIAVEGLGNLAHTIGWRHCLGGPRVPLLRLFRMGMAGYAINYLTPSASMGGEVSRAALLTSDHSGSQAVSSVLLDKLMSALAHLALVLAGALFLSWRVSLPLELWLAMAAITLVLSACIGIFLWLQKRGKVGGVCRWLVEHKRGGSSLAHATAHLSKVDTLLKDFYRERPRDLLFSAGWHLAGHSVALAQVWLFLNLMGQPVAPGAVLTAGFLSLWFDLLTFAVPMNLGTLEGSRIMVFKALGCQALLGMAFGVAIRMAQLFWACFGLAVYAQWQSRPGFKFSLGVEPQSCSETFAAGPPPATGAPDAMGILK